MIIVDVTWRGNRGSVAYYRGNFTRRASSGNDRTNLNLLENELKR
jgi:hypothetical protein